MVVERTSQALSQCHRARLADLTSQPCFQRLAASVFDVYSPPEISLLAISKEDIFLQLIENAKLEGDFARIDLVSFSLNNLSQCRINTNKVQQFHKKTQADLKQKGGILKREDFDARKFRELTADFEKLNPGRLVRENCIVITTYRLEREMAGAEARLFRFPALFPPRRTAPCQTMEKCLKLFFSSVSCRKALN